MTIALPGGGPGVRPACGRSGMIGFLAGLCLVPQFGLAAAPDLTHAATWEVRGDASVSQATAGQTWTNTGVGLVRNQGPARLLVQWDRFEREAQSDDSVGLGFVRQNARRAYVSASVGASAQAHFRPLAVADIELGTPWNPAQTPNLGLVVSASARVARYRTSDLALVGLGLEAYPKGGRMWGSLRLTQAWADGQPLPLGLGARLDHQLSPRSRAFVMASNAYEQEFNRLYRIEGLAGGLVLGTVQGLELTVALGTEARGGGIRRTNSSLSLTNRF